MNRSMDETVGTGPMTVYCPSCGGSMRVAPAHVQTVVACPHCDGAVEPWQALRGGASRQPQPQYAPPPPSPRPGPHYAPGPNGPYPGMTADGFSRRNRWIAGALAILLGSLGVHRFYMGHIGIGLAQILISVLSLGVLAPVVGVWAFVEGILCFCGAMHDVDGLPLSG